MDSGGRRRRTITLCCPERAAPTAAEGRVATTAVQTRPSTSTCRPRLTVAEGSRGGSPGWPDDLPRAPERPSTSAPFSLS